jgi:predicted NBD/HSP70 family sugar kinase
MDHRSIHNQRDLKHSNLSRVLTLLQREGLASKSDLAKLLGLSIVTVTKICDSLIEKGFCRYSQQLESTGGRRPMGVEFIPRSKLIGVVDLSREGYIHTALTDLNWKIVSERNETLEGVQAEQILDTIYKNLALLCDEVSGGWQDLLGCSVAIPGVENKKTGEIDVCNIRELIKVKLSTRLEKKLGLPVVVENDADLAALGFHKESDINNLMYLHFTEGIGLGLVVNGKLHTGAMGFAGELECFIAPDYKGNQNVLEDFASERGFFNFYRKELEAELDKEFSHISGLSDSQLLERFRARIEEGSSMEKKILLVAVTQLGNLFSLLIDLFNPEQVILGGAEELFLKLLLPGISGYIRDHSVLSRFSDIEILYGEGEKSRILEGGSSRFFNYWINQLEFWVHKVNLN